jgi:VWFA-related protein
MAMKPLSRCLLLIVPLVLLVNGGTQASPAAQTTNNDNVPVFHSQSKMVIVDVVVSDKSGKPVTGLKASDFQLTENGAPQTLSVFEEHTAVPNLPHTAVPSLPPNEYSNFPVDAPHNSVNLLLFDMLNTPAADQQWAREQMLKTLQRLPPGRQVALFVLGGSLQMVQFVSGNSEALVAAASMLLAHPYSVTNSTRQHQDEVDTINVLARNGAMGGTNNDYANQPGPESGGSNVSGLQGRLLLALAKVEGAADLQRVRITLEALQAIAHTMSAYPGRKQLIWVTSGIPFQSELNTGSINAQRLGYAPDTGRILEGASNVLADSQIAIYPVDIKGLATIGLTNADVAQGAGDMSSTIVRDARQEQLTNLWDSRGAMRNLATETGGRAFVGSNDLASAIDQSMKEGLHYYTLAYVPTNRKSDGLYRKIKVTSERHGLELAYRRGYFATQESETTSDESTKVLMTALTPGMPPATAVLMKARVLAPDTSREKTQINYAIQADSVQIREAPDQVKHMTLDFLAIARDSEGRIAASVSDTLDATLKPGFDVASLKNGIPAQQELLLKPGKYVLSLGVMDRNTRAMGTISATVTVPGASAR